MHKDGAIDDSTSATRRPRLRRPPYPSGYCRRDHRNLQMTETATPEVTGRIYGGESAAERVSRQRRQFMDAGLTLFGTLGYRGTSVRALCREAGLIDRYFYKNFRDTEDLLVAVYEEQFDLVEASLLAAIAEHPIEAGVELTVHAGLNAFFGAFEDARVARVCLLEVLGVSPRVDSVYLSRIRRFASLMVSLVQEQARAALISDDELQMMSVGLVGAISQSGVHWLLSDYALPRDTVVRATARIILGAVLAFKGPTP